MKRDLQWKEHQYIIQFFVFFIYTFISTKYGGFYRIILIFFFSFVSFQVHTHNSGQGKIQISSDRSHHEGSYTWKLVTIHSQKRMQKLI
jgi:hypothetical protein